MNIRLVDNWRRAWRWASVQVAAAAIAFGAMDPGMQAVVLAWAGVPPERVPLFLGGAFMLARVMSKAPKTDGADQPEPRE